MKRILLVHSNMEIGGAETSLLGLLNEIDYTKYQVDLFLIKHSGELMEFIPEEVNILQEDEDYKQLMIPLKDVLKNKKIGIFFARMFGKIKAKKYNDGYMIKEYGYLNVMPFLKKIEKKYDIALSFIDPHWIIQKKCDAKIRIGWLHTDFNKIRVDKNLDYKMWDGCDYIAQVSEACKKEFDKNYPALKDKSIVIENLLPADYLRKRADESITDMENNECIKLLSIGRFSEQKNFDNVPEICKFIKEANIEIRWYLIGYGGEENLIRNKIKEYGVEDNVKILGKKINPYPYIKQCDIYVQPSRYEGKAVTVREAQILCKPIIITDFTTAASQLEDGVDGIIVPMNNKECAQGIINLIKNFDLQKKLQINCKKRDYSNKEEVKKIYQLMGD